MKQAYYTLEDDQIEFLKGKINFYNKLLWELYNKRTFNKDKIAQEKLQYENEIERCIKQYGTIIGFFGELELKEYDKFKRELKDKNLKKILGKNVVYKEEIEKVLVALDLQNECVINKKLQYILKQAIKQMKSVVIWIL